MEKGRLGAFSDGVIGKGKSSPALYLAAIGFSFVDERLANSIYALVAAMWFIPDRRLARVALRDEKREE
jgi:hypothetical protein